MQREKQVFLLSIRLTIVCVTPFWIKFVSFACARRTRRVWVTRLILTSFLFAGYTYSYSYFNLSIYGFVERKWSFDNIQMRNDEKIFGRTPRRVRVILFFKSIGKRRWRRGESKKVAAQEKVGRVDIVINTDRENLPTPFQPHWAFILCVPAHPHR